MITPAQSGVQPAGPTVGSRFPDFALPDQHGDLVPFAATRAGRKALVVVYRSADW
jgi:peroxiredoxin